MVNNPILVHHFSPSGLWEFDKNPRGPDFSRRVVFFGPSPRPTHVGRGHGTIPDIRQHVRIPEDRESKQAPSDAFGEMVGFHLFGKF